MTYKLIAIDIDDTLINDDKKILPGTRSSIEEAIAQGVVVTIATGRMYASAKQLAQQLDLNVPIISYQGSFVKDGQDGTVLYERSVPVDVAQELFSLSAERGYHIQAYINDELYAAEENDRLIAYCKLSNIPYKIEPDFAKLSTVPSTKLLMIDEPEKLDILMEELQPRFGDRVHMTKSKPNFLEFVHKEGTKGDALRFLANYFGCTIDETIAIGDSWNDAEMIEAAGLGVAMGNAVPSLKEIADYVTASNNDEGVKQVIDKFVLNK
jgi:Cof subfamily protein (haloacid dehalogenase superfamily)